MRGQVCVSADPFTTTARPSTNTLPTLAMMASHSTHGATASYPRVVPSYHLHHHHHPHLLLFFFPNTVRSDLPQHTTDSTPPSPEVQMLSYILVSLACFISLPSPPRKAVHRHKSRLQQFLSRKTQEIKPMAAVTITKLC